MWINPFCKGYSLRDRPRNRMRFAKETRKMILPHILSNEIDILHGTAIASNPLVQWPFAKNQLNAYTQRLPHKKEWKMKECMTDLCVGELDKHFGVYSIEDNACTRVMSCFSAHERVILVQEQFVTWVHTFFICKRHNELINDDKIADLYTKSPCLTCSVFVLLMTSK